MHMLESRENPTPKRMASCGCHEEPFAWGVSQTQHRPGIRSIHKIYDQDWLAYQAGGTVAA